MAGVGSVSRETLAGPVSRETSRQGSVLYVAASSNWLVRGEVGSQRRVLGSPSAIAGRTGFNALARAAGDTGPGSGSEWPLKGASAVFHVKPHL